MRCRYCGWPIQYDEANRLWNHVERDERNKYFCWDSADYLDPDYAEPQDHKECEVPSDPYRSQP